MSSKALIKKPPKQKHTSSLFHFLTYVLLRVLTFLPSFLPPKGLLGLSRLLGSFAYYLYPTFRKRAESNLSLAATLSLNNAEVRKTAKACLQSLMMTCLEYPKLARKNTLSKIVTCENPEEASALLAQGKGLIFFCGHQANWELLFLEGTHRMKGAAVGRPLRNSFLYRWILRIREKEGGVIIPAKNAVKEGLRFLKKGYFLGIVGDQAMPQSGYFRPFLGREASTSPLPAILSYKTGAPLIVATTKRLENGTYSIRYAPALFPNIQAPMETEVKRLMDQALHTLEQSILENPEQWLWIHNRWKLQTLSQIRPLYRHDSIAVFFPPEKKLLSQAGLFRQIYPKEHLVFFVPKELLSEISQEIQVTTEIKGYTSLKETLLDDLRFKLIYNLTSDLSIGKFYKKRSALQVVNLTSLEHFTSLVSASSKEIHA